MNRSYGTRYPNEVQQFNIGVSKRHSIGDDGIIKYHRALLRPEATDILKPAHHYLFYYVVRDHFSGLFYTEFFLPGSYPTPAEFLLKAWQKKPKLRFCGIPEYLMLPDTVEKVFPGTTSVIEAMKIRTLGPTSGFQGGVRDLRTVGNSIRSLSGQPFSELSYFTSILLEFQERNPSHLKGFRKGTLWDEHVGNLRFPTID